MGSNVARVIAIALILSGCTTSLVSREQKQLTSGVQPGVLYRLPVLQYRLGAKFTLIGCEADDEGLLPMKVEITAEPITIEGEARLIDYERLGSATKTGNLVIDFHDGTQLIKSINVQVTDRSPEIVSNLLKTAAMVGRLATGTPGPGGGGTQNQAARVRCKPGVDALTKTAAAARKSIAEFPTRSQEIADRMAVHTARAQLGVLSAAEKRKAAVDLQATKDLMKDLADLTNAASELDKRLTFTAEWRFPEDSELNSTLQAPDAIATWLGALLDGSPADLGAQLDRTTISASLIPLSKLQICNSATDTDKCKGVSENDGIVYRVAAPGELKICEGGDAAFCSLQLKPLLRATVLVPQFGPRQVLRLHNGWGEDDELSAAFSTGGLLTSFKYASKSAPAEKASALGLDAAAQAVALADARRTQVAAEKAADTADTAARVQAETDALQHQIDLLTKRGELAALQARQSDVKRAEIDLAMSELAAQVALLKLEKERKELINAIGGQ